MDHDGAGSFYSIGIALPLAFVGGSWIILGLLVVGVFVIGYSWWSRTGSGINQREYGKVYGGAPGAKVPSTLGKDRQAEIRNYGRGTR